MLISCRRKGPSLGAVNRKMMANFGHENERSDGGRQKWRSENTPEVDVSEEQGGRWCSWVEYCSRPHAQKGRGHSEKQGPWMKGHSGRPGPSISSSVKDIPQPQGCCMDSTVNYSYWEPEVLLGTSWCRYGQEAYAGQFKPASVQSPSLEVTPRRDSERITLN